MKFNKLFAIILATAALAAGCQKSQEYFEAVYFTGMESSVLSNRYIDGPQSLSVSVSSSRKMSEPVDVMIAVDEAALKAYNADYGTDYKMLPEGSFTLSSDKVTIAAGSAVSNRLEVEIVSMDDFEFGALYCLPLRITGTSDGTAVLSASAVQYIVLNQLIKTRGVNLAGTWHIGMESMFEKPELNNLPACSMEIRMYANGWSNLSHGISSLIGVEENYLLRIGDVSIGGVDNPRSILNAAGHVATLSALNNPLELQRWYHVAVVDDGSTMKLYIDGAEVASLNTAGGKAINLGFAYQGSVFSVGRSANDYRRFNGYVSEARVWRRALTPVEMVNNQCYVNPATAEGLIGYWRLDEAEGRTFKDLSGNGYDGIASNNPQWTGEIHCPVVE